MFAKEYQQPYQNSNGGKNIQAIEPRHRSQLGVVLLKFNNFLVPDEALHFVSSFMLKHTAIWMPVDKSVRLWNASKLVTPDIPCKYTNQRSLEVWRND